MTKPGRLFLQCAFWTAIAVLCGPASLPAQTADAGGTPYTYREVEGQALKAYVFSPKESAGRPHPAILMFHGGAWQLGDASWMFGRAKEFAQDGMVAIAVEYRLSLHGQSPVEGVDDACAAFLWARAHAAEFHIDPNRVAGYGVSAGGHLVASAAALPAINGIPIPAGARPNVMLLYSPALNTGTDAYFTRLMNGHGDPHQYSPSDFISGTLPPTLIIQGEKDSIVYADDAKAFCARATQLHTRCELHIYPNVGHLLTRNLKVQYKDFDSDPEDAADAHKREDEFLRSLHYGMR